MPRARPQDPPRRKAPASPLQAARLARGWTQEEVINRIHEICPGHGTGPCRMCVNKLSDYENGKLRPTLQHVEALCRAFRAGPEELGLINWRTSKERIEAEHDLRCQVVRDLLGDSLS